MKTLYRVDRSEIIWTASDIDTLKQTCSPEIAHAVDLAAHTGLRLGDLVRLSWSHIGADEIVIATSKSRHRRSARSRSMTICGTCSRASRSGRRRC